VPRSHVLWRSTPSCCLDSTAGLDPLSASGIDDLMPAFATGWG